MKSLARHIALASGAIAAILSTAAPISAQSSSSTIKASLDSVYIIMGRVTPIHIEALTGDREGQILVPGDYEAQPPTLTEGVEIAGASDVAIEELGNDRYRLTQDLVIQSFDSGDYVIPPILFVSGADTIESNPLALKVVPVNVDHMETVHPYAPPLEGEQSVWTPRDFSASYTWLLWTLIILAVASAAGFYLYKKYLKGKKIEMPAPKPKEKAVKAEPPHVIALRELETLHAQQLWENGQEKEFYTRLTDILRRYIDARFGINAMEMTTSQILSALKRADLPQRHIRQVLNIADYVKFAKMKPFSDDNIQAYNDAVEFVRDTEPHPEPEAAPNA